MKFKKLISAVSSVAMAAGLFTGAITVKAAAVPTLTITCESSTATEAVFVVKAKGMAKIMSGNVTLTGMPALTSLEATTTVFNNEPTCNAAAASVSFSSSASYATDREADTEIAKIKYTFAEPITEDVTVGFATKTALGGYVNADDAKSVSYRNTTTGNIITLTNKTVTIKAPVTEVTVPAEKLADGVANDYEIDGKIYKYTPFKAAVDFASKTIKGAKIEINGVETAVDTTKFSNIPAEITGSATVGIIVKSLDSQTVGAVKLIIE